MYYVVSTSTTTIISSTTSSTIPTSSSLVVLVELEGVGNFKLLDSAGSEGQWSSESEPRPAAAAELQVESSDFHLVLPNEGNGTVTPCQWLQAIPVACPACLRATAQAWTSSCGRQVCCRVIEDGLDNPQDDGS